jgi:hypothetical protein
VFFLFVFTPYKSEEAALVWISIVQDWCRIWKGYPWNARWIVAKNLREGTAFGSRKLVIQGDLFPQKPVGIIIFTSTGCSKIK